MTLRPEWWEISPILHDQNIRLHIKNFLSVIRLSCSDFFLVFYWVKYRKRKYTIDLKLLVPRAPRFFKSQALRNSAGDFENAQ